MTQNCETATFLTARGLKDIAHKTIIAPMLIHGWGRYPVIDAQVIAPRTRSEMRTAVLRTSAEPAILRGLGRSYGDSSLSPSVISTAELDHLLHFDPVNGRVRCAAGSSLADLVRVFLPHGWFLPVTPGTKFVTVAGAIASDVHGKNHHFSGCFSEFVECFDLMLADGSIRKCSRTEHPDLYHATCGGMGLTGAILGATIRLQRVESAWIEQTSYKARDLRETIELLEASGAATYSVAWTDCMAKGSSLGRSVIMTGEHSREGGLGSRAGRPLSVPFDLPSMLLNRYSISIFNAQHYHRVASGKSSQRVHLESFFYPLDDILQWNRLYGKNGFTQYQMVIPEAAGLEALTAIYRAIAYSGITACLGVLKLFGDQNANMLSFPMRGYTLAVDLRFEPAMFSLLDRLDDTVLACGGRLYLAKDARMSAATFKSGYPRWEAFQQIRARFGAIGHFASQQSRRLGLD